MGASTATARTRDNSPLTYQPLDFNQLPHLRWFRPWRTPLHGRLYFSCFRPLIMYEGRLMNTFRTNSF
jgi:hypothetical protein